MNDSTTQLNGGDMNKNDPGGRHIMDAIRERDIRMRSRRYFALRAVLIALASLLLFLVLLYVTSFIIYALHTDGVWFAPDYGLSGWSLFFAAMPWGLLILALVLVLLLANLLRRYAFVYQRPLFYFLFAFIIATALGGFFLAATAFHPDLFQYSAENIPILGSFYAHETALPASVHRGVIVSFSEDGSFVIVGGLGTTSTVTAAEGVVFIQNFHVGDTVLVFGTRDASGTISAFGIQRIAVATSTPAPAPSGV